MQLQPNYAFGASLRNTRDGIRSPSSNIKQTLVTDSVPPPAPVRLSSRSTPYHSNTEHSRRTKRNAGCDAGNANKKKEKRKKGKKEKSEKSEKKPANQQKGDQCPPRGHPAANPVNVGMRQRQPMASRGRPPDGDSDFSCFRAAPWPVSAKRQTRLKISPFPSWLGADKATRQPTQPVFTCVSSRPRPLTGRARRDRLPWKVSFGVYPHDHGRSCVGLGVGLIVTSLWNRLDQSIAPLLPETHARKPPKLHHRVEKGSSSERSRIRSHVDDGEVQFIGSTTHRRGERMIPHGEADTETETSWQQHSESVRLYLVPIHVLWYKYLLYIHD